MAAPAPWSHCPPLCCGRVRPWSHPSAPSRGRPRPPTPSRALARPWLHPPAPRGGSAMLWPPRARRARGRPASPGCYPAALVAAYPRPPLGPHAHDDALRRTCVWHGSPCPPMAAATDVFLALLS
ncbi:hypothetical protein ZWY2020_040914 [Hordeum vulgare]|nr:hypothetical protein ZWY2020_040914 [Hordeum vulgare]